jgi:hypothetical protein
MTDFIGHGWRVGSKALHVGKLPDRKQVALYLDFGGSFHPLAYFRNEQDAQDCLDMLDKIGGGIMGLGREDI